MEYLLVNIETALWETTHAQADYKYTLVQTF
jgi:hypothetical protein